jgi:hypothetical protein
VRGVAVAITNRIVPVVVLYLLRLPQAFGDVLGGLLSVVAQNLTLKITAAEGTRIYSVLTKFPVKTVREGLEYGAYCGASGSNTCFNDKDIESDKYSLREATCSPLRAFPSGDAL